MQATLDRLFRIVIPKKVREDFNLKPGSLIRIEKTEDSIVLKPIQGESNLIEKDGVLVFSCKAIEDLEDSLTKNRKERLKNLKLNG